MNNLTGRIGFIPVYETLPDAKDFKEGGIIIDYSQKNPKLKYSKLVGEEMVWVTIDGSDSPTIPANFADLESQLRRRDWNISERMYSDVIYSKPENNTSTTGFPSPSTTTQAPTSLKEEDSNLEEKLYISRSIGLDVIPEYSQLKGESLEILISDDDFIQAEADDFCSIYEELINLKMKILENESIDLGTRHYYDIISIRDIERGSSVIDLISLNGSNYTNLLNLNTLIEQRLDRSCNIVVGVEYAISGKIYSKEFSFNPYLVENEDLIFNSFITNILNYVSLDFHNGCLRVFPMSKEVTECIISYCYINYEGLF